MERDGIKTVPWILHFEPSSLYRVFRTVCSWCWHCCGLVLPPPVLHSLLAKTWPNTGNGCLLLGNSSLLGTTLATWGCRVILFVCFVLAYPFIRLRPLPLSHVDRTFDSCLPACMHTLPTTCIEEFHWRQKLGGLLFFPPNWSAIDLPFCEYISSSPVIPCLHVGHPSSLLIPQRYICFR